MRRAEDKDTVVYHDFYHTTNPFLENHSKARIKTLKKESHAVFEIREEEPIAHFLKEETIKSLKGQLEVRENQEMEIEESKENENKKANKKKNQEEEVKGSRKRKQKKDRMEQKIEKTKKSRSSKKEDK